jgi:uncharacterized membrane protein
MVKKRLNLQNFKLAGKSALILAIGLFILGWLLNTPAGLLGKADAVGYAVCHRLDFRSFHLGERQLPLCARCSGMYLGAVLGIGYLSVFSRRKAGFPRLAVGIIFFFFVAAFALDGANSLLNLVISDMMAEVNPQLYQSLSRFLLYQPQNLFRLLTGTGMGLVMAGVIYPAFNQSVWLKVDMNSAIPSVKYLLPLLGLSILVVLAVLSENPLLLYPLALISAAGVLLLLSMIYTMLGLMMFKRENRFTQWRQLVFPFFLGFGFALLQIALIDYLRFTFTQTWGGFPLL